MFSLKPLTPPSVSITKATSTDDILLCDPTATQQPSAPGGDRGGGVARLQAAPPPVVITSPAACDIVGVDRDTTVMRRNLSVVDAADGGGATVDAAAGTADLHGALPSPAVTAAAAARTLPAQ